MEIPAKDESSDGLHDSKSKIKTGNQHLADIIQLKHRVLVPCPAIEKLNQVSRKILDILRNADIDKHFECRALFAQFSDFWPYPRVPEVRLILGLTRGDDRLAECIIRMEHFLALMWKMAEVVAPLNLAVELFEITHIMCPEESIEEDQFGEIEPTALNNLDETLLALTLHHSCNVSDLEETKSDASPRVPDPVHASSATSPPRASPTDVRGGSSSETTPLDLDQDFKPQVSGPEPNPDLRTYHLPTFVINTTLTRSDENCSLELKFIMKVGIDIELRQWTFDNETGAVTVSLRDIHIGPEPVAQNSSMPPYGVARVYIRVNLSEYGAENRHSPKSNLSSRYPGSISHIFVFHGGKHNIELDRGARGLTRLHVGPSSKFVRWLCSFGQPENQRVGLTDTVDHFLRYEYDNDPYNRLVENGNMEITLHATIIPLETSRAPRTAMEIESSISIQFCDLQRISPDGAGKTFVLEANGCLPL